MKKIEVAIVGAGLAGLACARILVEGGKSVVVFEAADAVGGRIRTDHVEGFLLDRGFQVFLTAYPEAKRWLDYRALDFKPFFNGALIYKGGKLHRLADPFREPSSALATLFAPIGTPLDKLRVLRLRKVTQFPRMDEVMSRPEITALEAVRERYGFSDGFIEAFIRPFFGGISFDTSLSASSRMFDFVFRMFGEGYAVLPAGGMEAIPKQIAAVLPAHTVQLNTPVSHIDQQTVHLRDGRTVEAKTIVVATDAPTAAEHFGIPHTATPRGTVAFYYAADRAPIPDAALVLNGTGSGLVNNAQVLSNVQPTYAPDGKALISAVVVGIPAIPEDELERKVREELGALFGSDALTWKFLRAYTIPHALPGNSLDPLQKTFYVRNGLFCTGDARSTPSINGALLAGRRLGEVLLQG